MISDFQHFSARRAFFVNYARKKGFDPLVPDNWYHQVRKDFAAQQVNKNKNKNKNKYKYERTQQERKKAKRQKEIYKLIITTGRQDGVRLLRRWIQECFDGALPWDWTGQIKTVQDYRYEMFQFQISSSYLFDFISGLQSNDRYIAKWKEESKRRAVLEAFAKANHFDPLKPENWRPVTTRKFIKYSSVYTFPSSLLLFSLPSPSPSPSPSSPPPPPLPLPYPPLALPLRDHHLIFKRLQVPSSNTATTTAWKPLWRLCSLK